MEKKQRQLLLVVLVIIGILSLLTYSASNRVVSPLASSSGVVLIFPAQSSFGR